eukprot:2681332-Amphidinium_carterae.1
MTTGAHCGLTNDSHIILSIATMVCPSIDADDDPLDMDCAVAPIVSSGCSPSVSIGVVDAPGSPAVPVGTVPEGDVGMSAVDGLGIVVLRRGCSGLDGRTLTVAPAPIVTPLRGSSCPSGSIVKPSGRPAIVANDCLAVARGLIVEPK